MSDDEQPTPPGALLSVTQEDISTLSAHELEERIRVLEEEIKRARAAIDARGSSRLAAEALFGTSQKTGPS